MKKSYSTDNPDDYIRATRAAIKYANTRPGLLEVWYSVQKQFLTGAISLTVKKMLDTEVLGRADELGFQPGGVKDADNN